MRTGLVISVAALVACLGASTSPAAAQGVESEIQQVAADVQRAYSEYLHLIAPNHYDKASSKLREARALFDRGERLTEISERLAEARENLREADELKGIGQVLLKQSLEARALAAEANAPQFASDLWGEAEDKIRDAGREIEDGDQNDARQRAAEAEQLFRNAEYQAIREDLIGTAEGLREVAIDHDADDRARVTLARGDSLLAQAESTLADDRYRRAEAGRLARAAATAFERAARISQRAGVVDDDTDNEVEALVLGYEGQFAAVGEVLGLELTFAEGTDTGVDRINATIASLHQERRDLRSELADTRDSLAAARSLDESLTTQLAVQRDSLGALLAAETAAGARKVAEETRQRRATAGLLEARQDRQRKIERIRSNFNAQEAEVPLRGSELTITLQGLNFAVGSAEITPDNFQLLTRLQRSMREFPNAPIVITGHTDSQGNEAVNQGLSERRAQAVMQYLVANTDWNEDMISAIGFGASQPVATNETVDGRAQNRRIDVVITLPSLSSTSPN